MKQKYQDSIQKVLDSEVKREWEMPIQARPLIVIQTIVNYLFRDEKSSPIYKFRANLSGAFLGGVDFYKANLPNVIFYKADLKRTSFREANLQGATLHFALMEKTNFHKADLRGASLGSAYLMETNLKDADLRGARFWVAKSDDDSIFQNVNVTGADFSGVQCQYKFYNEYRDTVQTAMKQGKGLQTNLKGMMLYDKNGNLRDSDDEETKKKWFLKERAIIDDLSAKETQKIFEKREWEY